jgi:hypothetical protein
VIDWLESVDWAEWIRAGPFVAAVVALLLGLGLRDWIFKPKLILSSADDDPSARIVMPLGDDRVGGWARIRVTNDGRATARNVRVRILSIERYENGQWHRERSELDARALGWANTVANETVDIPKSTSRPLDLLAVQRHGHGTKAHFELTIAVGVGFPTLLGSIAGPHGAVEHKFHAESPETPSSRGHVFTVDGSWRVALVVAGENVRARAAHFAIGFSAEWWEPESGRLWVDTVRIGGPFAAPPAEPVVARTTTQMLEAAADEDNNA